MIVTGLGAQPQVKVEGMLKGYFLAPDGTLKVYRVPFAFPDRPLETDLPTCLFPVWANYYIQFRVRSEIPVKKLEVQVGKQSMTVTTAGTKKSVTVPEISGQWLRVHSKLGLSLRMVIELIEGAKIEIQPQYATQLGGVQMLKIDWRDLERIAKIRQFLRERGDELLPGLRADYVPFLLEGEDGQWVLIGKNFPESWRYKGKTPYSLDIFVPPFRIIVPIEIKQRILAGVVKIPKIGIVIILHYQPGWDTLEEIDKPEQSDRHGERTYALIHEVIHYWFGQKFGWKEKPKSLIFTDLDGYLAWIIESNALLQALEASTFEEREKAIKDFLFFRWCRHLINCRNSEGEQLLELDEGAVYFLAEKALEIGRETLQIPQTYFPSLFFLDLEPFEHTPIKLTLPFDPLTKAKDFGYAQAKLLDKVIPGWSCNLIKLGTSLDELLTKAIKFSTTTMTEENVRREIRQKAQQMGLTKTSYPSAENYFEVIILAPMSPLKDIPTNFDLKWLTFAGCELVTKSCKIKSERDVMVAQIQSHRSKVLGLRWFLPKSTVLRVKHEENDKVVLEGSGIRSEVAKSEVWKTPQGIAVVPKGWAKVLSSILAKKPEEVIPMKLSKAWTIIALAALTAVGSGVAQAQGVQVTGVVSGQFLNTWTNTMEYHTIDLVSDLEMCNYSLLEPLDDEEYEVTIQVTDPEAKLVRVSLLLTDGTEVSVTSDQPSGQLTLTHRGNWIKIFRPIGEFIEWIGKLAIKIVKETGEAELTKFLKDLLQGKKKGILAVHVRICDLEQDTVSAFTNVTIEVWRDNKRILPPPDASWIIMPDENGNWSCPLPKATGYLVRALKFFEFNTCPEVWSGPFKIEENRTTHAQVLFYYHKPIKGRVMEQTSDGQNIALSGAEAYLYKGEQQLSGPWISDDNGYFFIPPERVDEVLNEYGSGSYTVKVIPPSRSMMEAVPVAPRDGFKDVNLTKCERKDSKDLCPRALTIDVGTFIFTYEPPSSGPDGGS